MKTLKHHRFEIWTALFVVYCLIMVGIAFRYDINLCGDIIIPDTVYERVIIPDTINWSEIRNNFDSTDTMYGLGRHYIYWHGYLK